MEKQKKWPVLLMGSVMILMLGLIATVALAQDATPEAETPEPGTTTPETDGLPGLRGLGHWGGFGLHGGDSGRQENLAEALGITVEELEAAQEQAYAASVADAVAEGLITQEQADQILAMNALKSYIDRQSILATALGMPVDELDAALAGGQSLADLMTEKGIDAATLQTNVQTAYEAAVQQAVTDGVITQAQADEVLSGSNFGLFGHGEHGERHGGRGGRHGGGWEFGVPSAPDTTIPETTDTSFDA